MAPISQKGCKMKFIVQIEGDDEEELNLFLKEARKSTGMHLEVGRPSRKPEVYGMGHVEIVPNRVMNITVPRAKFKIIKVVR